MSGHLHPAYFGSELCCPICNPHCADIHEKKRKDGENFYNDCGHPKCPAKAKIIAPTLETVLFVCQHVTVTGKRAPLTDVETFKEIEIEADEGRIILTVYPDTAYIKLKESNIEID